MKKYLLGMAALLLLAASPVLASDNAPWLKSHITYNFAATSGEVNPCFDPAWTLAWEGTIAGDVNGVLRWWVDFSEAGYPNYVGRWEVLDDDPVYPKETCEPDETVIMAGYSAGTNFAPVDGVAEWSGKGIVTFVSAGYPQYAKWFGRRTIEGGWYNFAAPGLPNYGEGTLMIFDRPSNKH